MKKVIMIFLCIALIVGEKTLAKTGATIYLPSISNKATNPKILLAIPSDPAKPGEVEKPTQYVIKDLVTKTTTNINFDDCAYSPLWIPNSDYIAFIVDPICPTYPIKEEAKLPPFLRVVDSNGVTQFESSPLGKYLVAWGSYFNIYSSPNGKYLVAQTANLTSNGEFKSIAYDIAFHKKVLEWNWITKKESWSKNSSKIFFNEIDLNQMSIYDLDQQKTIARRDIQKLSEEFSIVGYDWSRDETNILIASAGGIEGNLISNFVIYNTQLQPSSPFTITGNSHFNWLASNSNSILARNVIDVNNSNNRVTHYFKIDTRTSITSEVMALGIRPIDTQVTNLSPNGKFLIVDVYEGSDGNQSPWQYSILVDLEADKTVIFDSHPPGSQSSSRRHYWLPDYRGFITLDNNLISVYNITADGKPQFLYSEEFTGYKPVLLNLSSGE